MGQAIDFEKRNDYIGKPPGQTDNQCYSLPVCRILTQIPGPEPMDPSETTLAHVSCWQLTPAEREEVARTGNVWVRILGKTLFPMSIHGIEPIDENAGSLSDYVFTPEEIKEMKGE